jgi:hypothetical protein
VTVGIDRDPAAAAVDRTDRRRSGRHDAVCPVQVDDRAGLVLSALAGGPSTLGGPLRQDTELMAGRLRPRHMSISDDDRWLVSRTGWSAPRTSTSAWPAR